MLESGGDGELRSLNDFQTDGVLVEDCVDEAENGLLDQSSVLREVAVLAAGGAGEGGEVPVLVVEEVNVAVFGDVDHPLGSAHGVVEPASQSAYLSLERASGAQGASTRSFRAWSSSLVRISTGVA